MVQIPQSPIGTNLDEVIAQAGNGALPLIPDDTYKAIIVKSEVSPTQKGGQQLIITTVIAEGKYKGTELIERLNIVNTGEKAEVTMKIAFETLARIAKAVGLSTMPSESSQLHNKPLLIKTKTEIGVGTYTSKNGEVYPNKDKSVLDAKGYAPVPKVGFVATPNDMPSAIPQTETTTGKMPWEQ